MKAISLYRAICVCVVGLGPLVACSDTSEPDPCFPLPANAELAVRDTTYQGTTLQGQSAAYMQGQSANLQGDPSGVMQMQGTTLQGDPPDYMSQQGTSLQGDPPGVMTQQGTSLQGDPPGIMPLQGISLQGESSAIMQQQGTSLQGESSAIMQLQGTSLQGESPALMQQQDTSLQGDPPGIMPLQGTSLQGGAALQDMALQGTSLEGHATLYMPNQGTGLQGEGNMVEQQGTRLQGPAGTQPAAQPRAYRGLADLNGAHLHIAADASDAVTVQDGQLVARGFAGTASLKGTSLTGVAPDGRTFRVEIVKVALDGKTERVDLLVDGFPACQLDQHGLFVAGRWDARGAHIADPDVVTYSCMDGVIAKCVSWGYAPWLTGDDVHASCTRLARADYCGTGTPWTMDGTEINVYDTLGVQPESTAGDMKFEAAWGTSGALCVSRPRYEIHQAGRTVLPGCFASLPRCNSLDEAVALNAVLANRSRVTPIAACQ